MKTLFVLRHADALPPTGSGDINRTLSDKGQVQARMLGEAMQARHYQPDFVLCSTALRTRQTLEGLKKTLKLDTIVFDKIVYHATLHDLVLAARQFDDTHASALIIGHNPVIHELAVRLSHDAPSSLVHGYPPATLTVASCPVTAWQDLKLENNTVLDVLKADDYCQ